VKRVRQQRKGTRPQPPDKLDPRIPKRKDENQEQAPPVQRTDVAMMMVTMPAGVVSRSFSDFRGVVGQNISGA
jgi:hypothetical protein